MRTGVTVSAIAHAVVIIVALIGLNSAHELTPEAEQSIAVDLVPITDTSSVTAGSEQSKVINAKTPSLVQDDKPVVPNQPTGNTTQDQPTPADSNTPAPTPTKNTAPAPTPQPAPQPQPPQPVVPPPPPPQPEPKPAPEPKPQPAPEPKPDPQLQPKPASAPTPQSQLSADNSSTPDTAPPAPAPAQQTASLEQKRADFQKLQDAAAKAAADAAAKAAADAAAKAAADAAAAQAAKDAAAKAAADAAEQAVADAKAAQAKKAAQAQKLALAAQAQAAAKAADEISSIINTEKTTGAKTGQGGTPTAGKANGTAAQLSRGEMDAFAAQVKGCFHLLPSEIESGQVVDLLVSVNQDGSVTAVPKVLKADDDSTGASIARAGQRAVMECGPYKTLPSAKYDEWKEIDLELDAQE